MFHAELFYIAMSILLCLASFKIAGVLTYIQRKGQTQYGFLFYSSAVFFVCWGINQLFFVIDQMNKDDGVLVSYPSLVMKTILAIIAAGVSIVLIFRAQRCVKSIRDVSESDQRLEEIEMLYRKNVEAKKLLGLAAQELILLQEDERKILAESLHEKLNQSVTSSLIHLELLRKSSALTEEKTKPIVKNMQDIYDFGKSIIRNLRPEIIRSRDLVSVIDFLIAKFSEDYDISLSFHSELKELTLYDERILVALYRVMSEIVVNFGKERRFCSALYLSITLLPDLERTEWMKIIFDGLYENWEGVVSERLGMGLGEIIIRERLAPIEGQFQVLPVEHKNQYKVLVTFPYKKVSFVSKRGDDFHEHRK
jgi:signal transduction histidine kinase